MVPGKKECRVVQVKTQADTSDGHVRLFCGTYREDENKRMTKVLYSPEDVDFIAAVALDRKRVAYIPLVLALSWSPRGSLTLRLDLPRNGQKRGIHWFHEYEILERWA